MGGILSILENWFVLDRFFTTKTFSLFSRS